MLTVNSVVCMCLYKMDIWCWSLHAVFQSFTMSSKPSISRTPLYNGQLVPVPMVSILERVNCILISGVFINLSGKKLISIPRVNLTYPSTPEMVTGTLPSLSSICANMYSPIIFGSSIVYKKQTRT